mgnify:CR=1 FL=1
MNLGAAKPWINIQGKLCEGPLWAADTETLYWTDIDAGRLYRYQLQQGKPECIYEGETVGGFTCQTDGSLLLFRVNDIAIFRPDTGEVCTVAPFRHDGSKRFNDVIAAPDGRVFAGTIGKTSDSGGLFRIDHDGSATQVAGGTGISNGMGFTPDLSHFYWTCSTRRRIYRYPYCQGDGTLGEPVIFHQGTEEQGFPDGLTVDSEGNVYSIRWTAREYGLIVFNPDGRVIHQQKLPPRASSSLAFFGPTLTDIAITSAEEASDPNREADLYLIQGAPVAGRLEFRSAVGL